MDYIYIISIQRGQGSPEIHSMWVKYEDAIEAFYGAGSFYYLYKFPVNEVFSNGRWSDIKIQKSCKYRVIFKDGELKNELKRIRLDKKLDNILDS